MPPKSGGVRRFRPNKSLSITRVIQKREANAMTKKQLVTRSQIKTELQQLGVAQGDTIMLHISIKSIGPSHRWMHRPWRWLNLPTSPDPMYRPASVSPLFHSPHGTACIGRSFHPQKTLAYSTLLPWRYRDLITPPRRRTR